MVQVGVVIGDKGQAQGTTFEQKKELRVRQLFLEYLFKYQPYLGAASAAGGALSASNLAFHLVPNDHERGVTVSAQSL